MENKAPKGEEKNTGLDSAGPVRSIRTEITLLTVCAIVAAMVVAMLMGVIAIRNIGRADAEKLLLLLCETGEKDLNFYFESVEQSVEMVSAYVQSDLKGLSPEQLAAHLENARDIFARMARKTNGVLTYYYRIDPAVSDTVKGFWFVNLNGEGFEEHEATDITLYDVEDTEKLVWFTVPRATGKPIWLPPYITDNLDVRVISYNVPIYYAGTFVGVVGIEIDYSTMAEQVDHITLYENGYAYINDAEGTLIYHPRMDVTVMDTPPVAPPGMLSEEATFRYTYDGVEKQAAWLPLSNGMRLNVSVPVAEINAGWHGWIREILIVSVLLLAAGILVTMRFSGKITRPLRELAAMAEQVNAGNYDCKLDYRRNNEVGTLTRAFNGLISHLKTYISDLNDLAYADALTAVHNKGAFDIYVQNLQAELEEADGAMEFAICIFDCNNLKAINDQSGHDKGDIYLKTACGVICDVFDHSPVFRIGGDEFAVVLQNADYRDREELLALFDQTCITRSREAELRWEQADIARGLAVYDRDSDEDVNEVVRRADKLMYENKWKRKQALAAQQG